MVIKSILQRFWLVAIQQWLPCRQINLIHKKPIGYFTPSIDYWRVYHNRQVCILGAVHITDDATARSGNNVYRDPNKRGDCSYKPKRKKNKIKKKANSTKGSS